MNDCRNCANVDNEYCFACDNGNQFKSMTNAERIRSMSDEELAEFMALNTDCYYCRAKDNDRCASLATTPCGDIWLDWLKQEVKEK